jgi:phosphoglycerate dehydrogenase-like enzyme
MELLIAEPIDGDISRWLAARHPVREAPGLARDPLALRHALGRARAAILPPAVPVDAALLHHAPALRVLGRVGPGPDNIDVDACAAAQVELVRSPVASAMAEAEFMVGALLQMLRRLPQPRGDIYRQGRELGACTVGLVGLTPAARAMAQVLTGFGSRIVGYDPAVHASDGVWARWQIAPLGLRELLARADAVCVQLPYFTRYRGLLGERFLPHCRNNQVLVCITPSAVFDDAALARALDHGVIAAAWLDNVDPGTLDAGRPLLDSRNLLVTPRLASTTRESAQRAAWLVARRIDELLAVAPDREGPLRPAPPAAAPGLAGGPATP